MSTLFIRRTSSAIATCLFISAFSLDAVAGNESPYLAASKDRPIRAAIEGALWHDTEWGWIVTDNQAAALQASIDQRAAIAAFYAHFGVAPGRGGVIQSKYAGLFGPLRAHGLQWLVPWRFAAPGGAQSDQAHGAGSASGLRHEIAHALFLALVIPGTRKGQYGGDAPDWLDESAAMIAEADEDLAARRKAFVKMVGEGRVKPLSTFVSEEHPIFQSRAIRSAIADAKASNPTAPVVLSFKAQDIGVDPQTIGDFYAQSLAVFDFLHERTGDRRILAVIAKDFLHTRDPLSWISLIEAGQGSDAIPALDAAFEAWSKKVSAGGD